MDAALAEFAEEAAEHVRRHAETGSREQAHREGREEGQVEGQVEVEYRIACSRKTFERHVAKLRLLFGEPTRCADTVVYVSARHISPVRCIVDRSGRAERVDCKTELCSAVLGHTVIDDVRVALSAKCSLEARVPDSVHEQACKASEAFCVPPVITRVLGDAPDDAFLLAHWDQLPFLRFSAPKSATEQHVLLPGNVAGTHFAFGAVTARVPKCTEHVTAKHRDRLTFTGPGFQVDCTTFRMHGQDKPCYNIEVEMNTDADLHFPQVVRFLLHNT
jgi:hypothetical protein